MRGKVENSGSEREREGERGGVWGKRVELDIKASWHRMAASLSLDHTRRDHTSLDHTRRYHTRR